ncbi:hypothetical protein MNBD_GAMMA09-2203 [hydrothermal vent metagenome]|uniref:DUF945 domain-containing protein n=1 Tax=hydrothermal vent metagenome TaxID=652676 RepID=A0A3B0Y0N4_9ZZZZ
MSTKRISVVEVILWIFIIVLVLLSLTPLALGFKIKSDYSLMISELSEVLQVDVQITEYEQGLFSSDSVLSVKLPTMDKPVLFREEIVHGPVYFGLLSQGQSPLVAAVIKGRIDHSALNPAIIQKLFGENTPFTYQNIVQFSGDVSVQAYLPPINASFESEGDQFNVQSSGLVFNENYSPVDGRFSGEALIPKLKVQTPLYTISGHSVNVSFSAKMGENQILIGDTVISINVFDLTSGEDQFALRDLTVRTITSESGSLINSGIDVSVQEILASNQKFGPAKLVFKLDGISAQSLNQLQLIQDEVAEMHEKGLPPEQINSMMTGQIMGIVPDLIKQAAVKVKPLSVSSELGKLQADMDFTLKGIDADTPADPIFLLGAVSMNLNVSIDEALLKQFISWELQGSESENGLPLNQRVSENIQGMVSDNWLKRSAGGYVSKISMHDGQLLINEKAVDPMQQIMSTMGGVEH